MSNTIGKNMMIVTSSFRNVKSFTLIPATSDCPYVEAMYDPSSGILAVISKVMKQSYHMIPKLDDEGQPMRLKNPNQQTGKTVKEQRVSMDTFSEFYISDKKDIEIFIQLFAINADNFEWKEYLEVDINKTEPSKIILPGQ